MKMATLRFSYLKGGKMTTWRYKDLAISIKCFFQFYNNLVVGAKFLLPFGKKIIGWDFKISMVENILKS
jgi:hypothetical protein